jgi:WD40 repeat protein
MGAVMSAALTWLCLLVTQAAADARAQAKIADEKSKLAITNSDLAKASQIIAEQKTVEAERNMNIAAVLLLGSNPHPSTGRSMRALLKSFELARDIDRLDMVMPQLHEAVRYLAAEPFWPFELEGHFDSSCVSFSPSGEYLLSGGQDYTYRLWSLRVPEGSFVPAARPPKVLTCEVDGESLAVDWGKGDLLAGGTSHYNSICLWHKDATGEWTLREKLQPLDSPGNADISTVAFSPSGNLLAAGSTDGSLIVWNVSSASSPAAPRVLVPANETEAEFVQYRAVAWSPDDAYLITGGIDRVLRVWEVEGGAVVATNPTTTDINAVDVLADGGVDDWETLRIAAVTDLYDSESFVLFLALEKVGTGNVSLRVVQSIPGAVDQKGVAWSPDNGSMLAVTGDDYRVHLWALNQTDGTATTRLHDMQLSYDVVSRSRSLAWGRQSPAQHHPATSVDILAAATANGAIYMFQRAPDLRDLGPRLDRMYCHLAYEAGLKHSVRGQAITSDMSKLATSAFHGTICIFRRDPNTLRWRNTEVLGGYGAKGVAPKRAVVWSPDNSLLAVGSDDGMLYVYGFRGNEEAVEVAAFIAHESACRFVSFDPTSRYVVSSGDRSDPTILIREVGAGPERELRLPLHTHQVRCVTWIAAAFGEASSAAMGVIASVGDDGGIRVTEIQRAADGKLSLTRTVAPGAAEAGRYVSLAWGAASGLLAAGDTHGGVTLWRRSDSWGGEWNDTHHSNSHTASVDNLVWVRSSLVSGSKDMAMGVVEVDPVTKRVVRNYKTDVDCRIPFAVEESRREGGGPRVVCLRARSSVAGDKWTDPELPVTVEAETVLVGFDHQYDLFQKMVYGRLSLDDLAALGYQDLARLAAP